MSHAQCTDARAFEIPRVKVCGVNYTQQAASLTERNNRLAHSVSYRDPYFGYFVV